MAELLLEWVFTSIFLILVVLALRAALGRRVSAGLRYGLWAVVLVRLLVPVQLFTSPIAGTWVFSETRTDQNIVRPPAVADSVQPSRSPAEEDVWNALGGQDGPSVTLTTFPQAPNAPAVPDAPEPPSPPDLAELSPWLGWTWLVGSAAVAVVLLASNLRFWWKLRRERIPLEEADLPLQVYVAAGLPSPCLFGVLRPAVYITPEAWADPKMLRHVLAHEYTHYKHGDHIWSLLRCAALAAHWWNPLVWLAALLSQRDAELACDEGALKRLGDGERAGYGGTLLALVTAKPRPGDLFRCATTMAGDKKSLKERITRIASAPKRILWAAVAAVLVTALACVCAFGQAAPVEQPEDESKYTPTYTMSDNGVVLAEGLGDAYVEWRGPDPSPSGGWLHFNGDPAFCCLRLAGREVDGSALWLDEGRTGVSVVFNVLQAQSDGESSTAVYINFDVELDSGTGTVTKWVAEPIGEEEAPKLTNQEMLDMARVLAELLTEAEAYYNSVSAPSLGAEMDGKVLRNEVTLDAAPDLNRNGVPETLVVGDVYWKEDLELSEEDRAIPLHRIAVGVTVWEDGRLLWTGMAPELSGGGSLLLYSLDGEDYLLELDISGHQGQANGSYRMFTLENGAENTVRENQVEFDFFTYTNSPGSIASVIDNFDPVEVAAFADEVDSLLCDCTLLADTGSNLLENPLRVDLTWLEGHEANFQWDDGQTTLDNLTRFKLWAAPAWVRDLTRNGVSETIDVVGISEGMRLEVYEDGELIWSEEGYHAHAGYNAIFLCTLDSGRDCLLRYHPYMAQGWGTSYTSDAMFIAGTYDGLLHYDVKGVQQPALATSYDVSADGLTYTFHIREGVKWMDQQGTEIGEVTADDWVAAMEHLLDNADELGYLLTVEQGCGLKGFDAYLDGEATFEDVGVKAVDKYTLEYTLEAPFPPFPSMLGYSIFAPLNRDFYRSQGGTFGAEGEVYTAGDFGKTPSNIAYCGPYLITNHTAQNVTRYEANPNYWNADAVKMKTIVYSYNDGSDATRSYNEAKSGTISGAGFNAEALQAAKSESPDGETATYFDLYAYVTDGVGTTYCGWLNMNRTIFTNYDNDGIGISPKKDNEDAIARTRAAMVNQHFRLAVLMGIDRGAYQAQRVGEELKFAALRNSFTPGTFQVLSEDVTVDINGTATDFKAGTFFGEIEQAQLDADGVPIKAWDAATSSGDGFDGWYNAANAAAELELAIAELAQVGVDITADNPIYIDYPYETYNNTSVNCAQAIKKSIESALGSKVIVNLVGFDKDTDYESCTYRFATGVDTNFDLSTGSGWGPDYGDAQSYLDVVQYAGYMCKNMGLF